MRKKIIQLADILSQAAFMVVKIAIGNDKTSSEEEHHKLQDTQEELLDEAGVDDLINQYLGQLDNMNKFFGDWDKREDDDKFDEFLHYFYHLQEIINKMEVNGMIKQSTDEQGTTIIEIPKLEKGRDDN